MAWTEVPGVEPLPYVVNKADNVKFASGIELEEGAVVAQESTNYTWKGYDPNASDGTEEPRGILLKDLDSDENASAPVAFDGIFGSLIHIKLSDTFNGDGSTTSFTLTREPFADSVSVTIDGEAQESGWSVSGNTITFESAPDNGATIVVSYKGKLNEADKQKLRDKGMVVRNTTLVEPNV